MRFAAAAAFAGHAVLVHACHLHFCRLGKYIAHSAVHHTDETTRCEQQVKCSEKYGGCLFHYRKDMGFFRRVLSEAGKK